MFHCNNLLIIKHVLQYSDHSQVFDVTLNGVHTIVSYLDIFEKVGKAVAHDEYIPFKVSKGKVLVNDEESELAGKKIKVEFIKVIHRKGSTAVGAHKITILTVTG